MFGGLLGKELSTWQNLSVRWGRFAGSVGGKIDDRGNAFLLDWFAIAISARLDNTESRWDTNLNQIALRHDRIGARQRK